MNKKILLLLILFSSAVFTRAQNTGTLQFTVDGNPKMAKAINPDMYGIFFEDINLGADGGLYAELIKNRSFEFTESPLMGWLPYGKVEVLTTDPCFDRNPHYVHLTNDGSRRGTGIINEGFRGVGVQQGGDYRLSFYARNLSDSLVTVNVEIISAGGEIIGWTEVKFDNKEWKKQTTIIHANETCSKAKIRVNLKTKNTVVDIDHISLFPPKTWKDRENGMRADLAQALNDLQPGVFRFPGGCIIEGNTLDTRYDWKKSVGPVENRPLNENRWNYTFQHRFAPDYFQTYGLGFFEYFQLCEDFGAEALPVISCGFACEFESTEKVPLDELGPYVQDALDLIEFAKGDATTKWGKVRADMGHPAPFSLKYLAIGNEQFDFAYAKYLEKFVAAIKSKHPEVQIIGTAGPYPDGEIFDGLWKEMTRVKADLVDEHYYRPPAWFLSNARRYDNYDRKAPKVFAGEYACHVESRQNSFYSALCESAFMTGLERNADVVRLATYAPLFAHVDGWQWKPDMIWFDNLRSVKSANYYVQQLYATYKGTQVLPLTMNSATIAGEQDLFASATRDTEKNQLIIKVANTGKTAREVELGFLKMKNLPESVSVKHIVLKSENDDENTLDNPTLVVPTESTSTVATKGMKLAIEPMTFNVYVIQL